MAVNYPTTLDAEDDTLPVESASTVLATNHITSHQGLTDAVIAIETKVGVDSSAVTSTHDYKLSGVADGTKAVSLTGEETLTNKTLTSPTINTPTITEPVLTVGSDAKGDLYYRNATGFTRLPIGTDGYILKVATDVPAWEEEATVSDGSYATKGILQGLTDAATSGLTIAAGVVSVNSGTSANSIVKLDASAKLPAVDGSALTNVDPDTLETFYISQIAVVDSLASFKKSLSTGTFTPGGVISVAATTNGSAGSKAIVYAEGLDSSKDFTLIARFKLTSSAGTESGIQITVAPQQFSHTANSARIAIEIVNDVIYAVTNSGSGQTNTDISGSIVLTDYNLYKIQRVGSSIYFYINGSLVATHTTNLPGATADSLSIGTFKSDTLGTAGVMTIYSNVYLTQSFT